MSGWRRVLRLTVGIVLAVTVYFVVPIETESENLLGHALVSLLIIALLAAGVLWQVVRHLEHPELRVDGLVFAVVLAVLAFALGFLRLATTEPGQIPGLVTRVDSLYFTLSTLLTVGFGDIHAQGQTARELVIVAMLFNVVVIATAVSTMSNLVRRRAKEAVEARRELESEAHGPVRGRRTQRNPK